MLGWANLLFAVENFHEDSFVWSWIDRETGNAPHSRGLGKGLLLPRVAHALLSVSTGRRRPVI